MANVYSCQMVECVLFYLKADSEEQALEWLQTHTSRDVCAATKNCDFVYDEDVLCRVDEETADIDISTGGEDETYT